MVNVINVFLYLVKIGLLLTGQEWEYISYTWILVTRETPTKCSACLGDLAFLTTYSSTIF